MPFSHMCHYYRFKYTPLVNSTMLYKRGAYLPRFAIEKFRAKCFLEHVKAHFHIFPYNALLTCHFHIYFNISVQNTPPS